MPNYMVEGINLRGGIEASSKSEWWCLYNHHDVSFFVLPNLNSFNHFIRPGTKHIQTLWWWSQRRTAASAIHHMDRCITCFLMGSTHFLLTWSSGDWEPWLSGCCCQPGAADKTQWKFWAAFTVPPLYGSNHQCQIWQGALHQHLEKFSSWIQGSRTPLSCFAKRYTHCHHVCHTSNRCFERCEGCSSATDKKSWMYQMYLGIVVWCTWNRASRSHMVM